jgi:hypothetical protein
MDQVVYFLLGLSLVANAYFAYALYIKKTPLSKSAAELLGELNAGGRAVVDIRVLDASGLFFRSPRG